MSISHLFFSYLIIINVVAYLCMVIDKILSKGKNGRIPEKTLFGIAFLLGAAGIFLGMLAPIRHKFVKTLFKWGIPLVLLMNGAAIWFAVKNLD